MSPPWIKQRAMPQGAQKYERVDGWVMHHIGTLTWCLHDPLGRQRMQFTIPQSRAEILALCVNNCILRIQFLDEVHQEVVWPVGEG